MIPANKSRLIEWGFKRFNRFFLNHHFQSIHLLQESRNIYPQKTLYLVNHSSWWDPLVIYYLNDKLIKSDGYGMMHENGIERFPFFKKIGAFSINPDKPKDMIHSINYAVERLNGGTVWIFPQGKERHNDIRPLGFQSGVAHIIRKQPDIRIVPLSITYTIGHTRKPDIHLLLGNEIPIGGTLLEDKRQLTSYLEERCIAQLDYLKERTISENMEDFIKL
ncbi:lysophospholipid acyltransferase family protein [Thalassobacillus hwangdonensis]|uniref:Lysophospholipid acyltransferase family protein n=1 Tax=Thalassobacillus hwangdonensis TaxID=546108 RepID=A0ABW3KXV4_9BACI